MTAGFNTNSKTSTIPEIIVVVPSTTRAKAQDAKFRVLLARIMSLVVGVVLLGLGLHSHFKSSWTKYDTGFETIKPHEYVCEFITDAECPSITLERYYIGITILCFLLSVFQLIVSFLLDLTSRTLKLIDFSFLLVAAVLLLLGACMYAISAEQIKNLLDPMHLPPDFKLLTGEKLAAAGFTVFQAFVYGAVALLISKQG